MSRTELYDLVWQIPISRLSARLGVSDVGLAKICARQSHPASATPALGAWSSGRAPPPAVPFSRRNISRHDNRRKVPPTTGARLFTKRRDLGGTTMRYASAAALLLCFASAESQQQAAVKDWHGLAVIDNRVVFRTTEDYLRVVNRPDERTREQLLEVLKSRGFVSHADLSTAGSSDRLVEDEYFAHIVNPDLCVQIGNYIFHVSPASEKVYALLATRDEQYAALVAEDTTNPSILQFDAGEDVLDAVRHSPTQDWTLFCNENSCGGRDQFTDVYWSEQTPSGQTNNYRMSGSVKYVKLGIYFTIKAQGLLQVEDTQGWHVATTDTLSVALAPVHYKPRCGTVVGPNNVNRIDLGSILYQPYQSAKALSRYRMRAQFSSHGHNSDWLEIRCVY